MRNSQRAIAAVLGVVVVLMVVVAIWVRVAAPEPRELSGEKTTKTYDLLDFDGVDVTGPWRVTIARGDAWQVSVEVPAEVVDEVRVDRDGGELELEGPWWVGNFAGREGPALEATITMPALESVHISGTAILSFSGFNGRAFSLALSGAGQLSGTASRFDRLDLDMSGAAAIDLSDVPVTDAEVDISGAGSVKLQMAGGRLSGDLSGAASLEYSGTVSEETVDKAGFVNVRRRN
jgi:hypothetical protein